MKKVLKSMLVAGAFLASIGMTAVAWADDAPAKADAITASAVATSASAPALTEAAAASVAAPTAAPAAAVASAADAAPVAAAPVPNKGDTAWMLVATLLVILMTLPGLALFYGGLVRSKNMLSILVQVFMIFAVIIVLWCIYGYSLAFTEGGKFIGSFDRLFLKGIWDPAKATFSTAATFSKGVVIPEFVYVAFQATFAAIT
ncbi:MAG: ammonia channel protein, partial [Burkholderiaceae bacterium]|nr:ammonia channel protein [Burkholderiaceae bacterium]